MNNKGVRVNSIVEFLGLGGREDLYSDSRGYFIHEETHWDIVIKTATLARQLKKEADGALNEEIMSFLIVEQYHRSVRAKALFVLKGGVVWMI